MTTHVMRLEVSSSLDSVEPNLPFVRNVMNDRIMKVVDRIQEFMQDKDDSWDMPIEAARFIHGLALMCRAKSAVEIGTSYGHSGLWLGAAMAANGGSLITIDQEQRKSDLATGFYAEAGLSDVIICKTGQAGEILEQLEGPIDLVVNDADKPNVRNYVELVYPKLATGGVVITDNVTSHEEVRDTLSSWIRHDGRFTSALADIGNGLEVSIKLR
jgi:predicted O-methyltransferase YrrM